MRALAGIAMHLLWIASLLTFVSAVPEPNTLGFKFRKEPAARQENSPALLHKRQQGSFSAELANFGILYFINVTVGTPGQPFSLQIDTGSSDLWVPWANSEWCQTGPLYCPYGAYNDARSSTFQNATDFGEFFISYADGTYVDGTYFNDTINFGSTAVTGATMGLGQIIASTFGIMGIGLTENESSNDEQRSLLSLGSVFTYPSVIDNMVSQGHISTASYSLWLDDLNGDIGTILFGGVDSDKYVGDLVSLPIQEDYRSGTIRSFTVAWTGFTINTGGSSNNALDLSPSTPLPVILDSGSTLTYLPNSIMENLLNGFGATSDPQIGNVLPCDIIANDFSLTYTFGGDTSTSGASITVPLSEIMFPIFNGSTLEPYRADPSGPQLCQLGILSAGDGPLIFGDTFLRSAYVLYDLENLQIALAQTNFRAQPEDTNISEISPGAPVPGINSTASEASVTQTYTGDLPLNTGATSFGASDSTVTRSATFPLSTTGTVPPSATETGTAASQTSSRTAGSGSGTTTASASGSGSASGSAASATSSAGAVAARFGSESLFRNVVFCSLLFPVLCAWGCALL